MRKKKEEYKHLKRLGIKLFYNHNTAYVKWKDIKKALTDEQNKLFGEYYGMQTCLLQGPFPYDVEAVLVRIFERRLTGTQLVMD